MKAKLHKMMSGYILSLNGDIDDPYAIVNKELAEDYGWYKLSLKNCQAIENGYDLDELAEEEAKKRHDWNKHRDTDIYNELVREDAELIKIGLQKALEIFGDKKFSEKDMIHAYIEGTNDGAQFESMMDYDHSDNSEVEELSERAEQDFRKLLQQTEWDVEIIEFTADDLKSINNEWHKLGEPKLDADGCLILKTFKSE